jgi:hypothetical protein
MLVQSTKGSIIFLVSRQRLGKMAQSNCAKWATMFGEKPKRTMATDTAQPICDTFNGSRLRRRGNQTNPKYAATARAGRHAAPAGGDLLPVAMPRARIPLARSQAAGPGDPTLHLRSPGQPLLQARPPRRRRCGSGS